MEYENIICRFYVKGSINTEERHKAEKIGLKAYKWCNKTFVRPVFIPCYNKIWKVLFPNYTKEDYLDDRKMYTKLYVAILNRVAKIYVALSGGYWLKKWRKICLNYGYTFRPCTDSEIKSNPKCTHVIDDMISIKRIGE